MSALSCTAASPVPRPPTVKGSSSWSPKSPSAGPGSWSAWNAPGWLAASPTGTDCSSGAGSIVRRQAATEPTVGAKGQQKHPRLTRTKNETWYGTGRVRFATAANLRIRRTGSNHRIRAG